MRAASVAACGSLGWDFDLPYGVLTGILQPTLLLGFTVTPDLGNLPR